jgi:hypothetical protein
VGAIQDVDTPTDNAAVEPNTLVSSEPSDQSVANGPSSGTLSSSSTGITTDRAVWPNWLVKQMRILESVEGPANSNFQQVLDRFIVFEHALGYPEGQVRIHGFQIALSLLTSDYPAQSEHLVEGWETGHRRSLDRQCPQEYATGY